MTLWPRGLETGPLNLTALCGLYKNRSWPWPRASSCFLGKKEGPPAAPHEALLSCRVYSVNDWVSSRAAGLGGEENPGGLHTAIITIITK